MVKNCVREGEHPPCSAWEACVEVAQGSCCIDKAPASSVEAAVLHADSGVAMHALCGKSRFEGDSLTTGGVNSNDGSTGGGCLPLFGLARPVGKSGCPGWPAAESVACRGGGPNVGGGDLKVFGISCAEGVGKGFALGVGGNGFALGFALGLPAWLLLGPIGCVGGAGLGFAATSWTSVS